MNRTSMHFLAVAAGLIMLAWATPSQAACTAADFGGVVDDTAKALRELNANGAWSLQAKLKAYQEKYGLSSEEIQTRAEALQDDKMSQFNREIEGLVSQMDGLSQTPSDQITCDKLEELRRVRDRLLTIMGQKSGYMLAKADLELDRAPGKSAAAPSAPAQQPTVPPAATPAERDDQTQKAERSGKSDKATVKQPAAPPAVAVAPAPAQPGYKPSVTAETPKAEPAPLNPDLPERADRRRDQQRTATNWQTENQRVTSPPAERIAPPPAERITPYAGSDGGGDAPTPLAPSPDSRDFTPYVGPAETHYSIDEISEAGRGIFGSVSSNFAAAINYTFQQFGQPNAYITGSEGGGAILAGLRYGKGMLFSKVTPPRIIYWQGPSLGYDLGAEGSDVMFLVYNLSEQDRIFGRFTGVGGAAYVAGGVGLNVLGKSDMIMVPIRAGVGLRIGANLAYLKFTERQTWNPF
jgi:Skp family chaperone for outer membrane proteins